MKEEKAGMLRLEELRLDASPRKTGTRAALELDKSKPHESNMYIYGVVYACVAMLLYKHSLFLQLCPIPIFIYIIKHAGEFTLLKIENLFIKTFSSHVFNIISKL